VKKYVGISELPKRDFAFVASVFVTIPLLALCVMAWQDPRPPGGAWIAIGALVTADLLIAAVLLFPRTYLTVDLERRVAVFRDRGARAEMPLADLQPLYIQNVRGRVRGGAGQSGRLTGWSRVQTAAAPVIFYRAAIEDERKAKRAMKRLNEKLGFTLQGPTRTTHLRERSEP
jgi:hypothetical protein